MDEGLSPYMLVGTTCKCWFCPECCVSKGIKLQERLEKRLEHFKSILMWTLTIDPTLFETPESAYDYARDKRAVSGLVKALRKKECLLSEHFFYGLEWQEDTEMPHWHLLLDAEHVPFDLVCHLWNLNRPKAAGPIVGERPGFGSIVYSKLQGKNPKKAAKYATKYLTKIPSYGIPSWVLRRDGRVHRYGKSHGFWAVSEGKQAKKNNPKKKEESKKKEPRKAKRTAQERIGTCNTSAVILKREEFSMSDGSVQIGQKWVDNACMPMEECKKFLSPKGPLDGRKFDITAEEAAKLSARSMHSISRRDHSDGFSSPSASGDETTNRRSA